MKLPAKDLTPGTLIPAPAHERKWLKTPLTVLDVTEAYDDARGQWLWIRCTFQSPYLDHKVLESQFKFRPETLVRVIGQA